jgi:tetratricopeptide (TPR) repeat protein
MKKFTLALLSILFFTNIAFACINDYSSRQFEFQPFPTENQLISGDFHIHSKAFYEWRINDRLKKIKEDSNNPALLDDLAVSYEKTGQTQLAIDTLQNVLSKYPNRYETLANLGTFYIHHNEYEKGLELLKKAIIINPQAHFGREIYQIKVVEYIISLKKIKPLIFPIQTTTNFADFILKGVDQKNQKNELILAIVGVSGMLKFGNNDSPILLEVLGDLYSRFSKDYIPNFALVTPQTHFTNIAKQFYIAAFIRSNLHDETILTKLFNSRNEL